MGVGCKKKSARVVNVEKFNCGNGVLVASSPRSPIPCASLLSIYVPAGLRGSTANWTNQNEAVADGALVSGELHRALPRIALQSRNSVKSSCHTRAMPPPTQRSAARLCSQPARHRADLCRVYASNGDDWAHYDLRAAHPHPVVHQQTPRGVVRGVSASPLHP